MNTNKQYRTVIEKKPLKVEKPEPVNPSTSNRLEAILSTAMIVIIYFALGFLIYQISVGYNSFSVNK